jgi:hypothetical protein
MSTDAPFSLSRTYEVRVENGDVTLTRISRLRGRPVWKAIAVLLVLGTPTAAVAFGTSYGLFSMAFGALLLTTRLLFGSTDTGPRALVRNAETISMQTAKRSVATEYRSMMRSSRVMVVNGELAYGEQAEAVLVLLRPAGTAMMYVVLVVSASRVVEVEVFSKVMIANELAAELRECLGLAAAEPAAVEEPGIDRESFGGFGLAIELFAIPASLGVSMSAAIHGSLTERVAIAAAVGIGLVVLDALAGKLAALDLQMRLRPYVKDVKALASRQSRTASHTE